MTPLNRPTPKTIP